MLSLLFGSCVKVHEDRNRTMDFFYININININKEYIISHGISTTQKRPLGELTVCVKSAVWFLC